MEKLPLRNEVPAAYKWDTGDIYKSKDEFYAAVQEVKRLGTELFAYKGKLKESLLEALKLADKLSVLLSDAYCYAALRADEDTADDEAQKDLGLISAAAVEASTAASYMTPEILSIKNELPKTEGLELYDKYIADIIRKSAHVLPESEERILALSSEATGVAGDVFSMLTDADMEFGSIKGEDGKDVEVTHGRFVRFLESADRRVRKDAFDTLYKEYGEHRHTLAALLNSHCRKNKFYKTARNYNSCLEMCIDDGNIPKDVYLSLISAARSGFPSFYRYMELRKKALGVEELHMYDMYVPFCKNPFGKIPFDKAKEMMFEALSPLGDDYVEVLKRAFDEGWIDVYENKGKRAGAYSNGNPTAHPYILLNYQDNIDSVFTLAHELGHALHSYYSNQKQPVCYRNYGIFVAEVASTFNEALLQKYLMERANEEQKLYLLIHALEQFRATFFRQTMFAEFELKIHEEVEDGGSLTAGLLSEKYKGLLGEYFGENVVLDEGIELEWSRIPHFYYDFYVYQYATGFAAAQTLADRVLSGVGLKEYREFLAMGCFLDPLDALRHAGVDLSTEGPTSSALEVFARLVEETEKLALG